MVCAGSLLGVMYEVRSRSLGKRLKVHTYHAQHRETSMICANAEILRSELKFLSQLFLPRPGALQNTTSARELRAREAKNLARHHANENYRFSSSVNRWYFARLFVRLDFLYFCPNQPGRASEIGTPPVSSLNEAN